MATQDTWLEHVRSGAAGWIAAADAKATGLLGATAIFCGFIGQSNVFDRPSDYSPVLLGVFIAFLIGNTLSLLAVLWPRTKREAYGGPLRQRSLLFFADIARMSYENFSAENPDQDELNGALREQTYVLCAIAGAKMKAYRIAVVCFPGCLISFILMSLTGESQVA